MSPKHELSDNWTKFEIFVPKYEEKLSDFSYKLVLRITKDKLQNEINQMLNEIDDANDEDQEIIVVNINKKQLLIKKIADILGAVM
jgi:hypothetical protein